VTSTAKFARRGYLGHLKRWAIFHGFPRYIGPVVYPWKPWKMVVYIYGNHKKMVAYDHVSSYELIKNPPF
jgi:hypothetical protein